jgi:mRNA interferase HicA
VAEKRMNREQFIRALRKLARERGVLFEVDKKSGKGSHYRVQFDGRLSTVQDKLNPGRIQRILKQLEIDPTEL